jgi:hypothetical protein
MYMAFGKGFIEHLIVASLAEFITLPLGLQGGCRGGFTMALVTHSARNRPMDVVIENARHVGAMRIMATGAA